MMMLSRIILTLFLTGILTGCEMLVVSEPAQPAPVVVYPNQQPEPVVVASPPYAYPSQPQPAQVPAPIQTPPLPPSTPSKPVPVKATSSVPAVIPAGKPIPAGDMPPLHAAPEKPAGSMSELPDPS